MIVARVQPISMGTISSGYPMTTGMPIVSSMQLATEKVAPEMEVWIRFCRWMLRNFLHTLRGIRENTMANRAPTREVLGVCRWPRSAPCG
jgi:hypothetical protein